MTQLSHTSRRDFLARAAGLAGASLLPWGDVSSALGEEPDGAIESANKKPPRVAALMTTFTHRSHAHVLLENFLLPYLFNGQVTQPGVQVVSFYVDQIGGDDMARDVAREHGITIYPTIAEALTMGGDSLAVDAVMSICEHGSYPVNAKGQMQYPRKEFFDQIVAVFRRSGRAVPVFSDKHLSYRWDWAKEMVDTSRELKFPLMAGSSVPLAQRRPPLELPAGAKITSAVSVHGGGVESYDFHALEVLQSQLEGRAGGETGVVGVQFLEEEPLWKAAADGLWSTELGAAAMAAEVGADHPFTKLVASGGSIKSSEPAPVHGILVHYRDGLRALALKVGESSTRWNFACRLEGEAKPRATAYYVGPWQNRNLFKALSHAIQTHFRERKAPYPVERTLLVSGVLDAAMDSRVGGGKPIDTPQLAIQYAAQDFRRMREMGASWKIITEDMPEPMGIKPIGIDQAG